jgi:hypothetical protein
MLALSGFLKERMGMGEERERMGVTSRLMINFLLIRTGLISDATVMRRFRCIQHSRRGGIRGFFGT